MQLSYRHFTPNDVPAILAVTYISKNKASKVSIPTKHEYRITYWKFSVVRFSKPFTKSDSSARNPIITAENRPRNVIDCSLFFVTFSWASLALFFVSSLRILPAPPSHGLGQNNAVPYPSCLGGYIQAQYGQAICLC